ncbi:GGDEF domain-containing protein [Paenibacillus sp. HB172176]|uniref:GGDEF domain-containing protein n=1 Tax=Paenibacillus sp. HB172176 TaxID=2493690 RepID=UPI001439A6E2|nr:GGDEF domain-containing protein [Paenibacillus sp. HB172176]
MEKTGKGLFHPNLIEALKSRCRSGGAAVIYLHLQDSRAAASDSLASWEQRVRGLFWKQSLGRDCFYFFGFEDGREPAPEVAALAARQLVHALKSGGAGEDNRSGGFQTGSSYIASCDHDSAEEALYRSMLDAMEQSAYNGHAESSKKKTGRENGSPDRIAPIPQGQQHYTIGMLASPVFDFEPDARVSEVSYLFDTHPKAQGAVIAKNGRPLGLLMKEKLHQMLAGQFGLPLYWHRSVERIMDNQPLVVDEAVPVEEVSQLAMARDYSQLYDIVLITREEKLIGAASIRSILECMTTLRTEEARSANPLTGLPGNAGIQSELKRRIVAREPMAVLYIDLDYFKWFNDRFGFSLGDELIRFLAQLLEETIMHGEATGNFIGHIGGDDFIAIVNDRDAEAICLTAIEAFDAGVIPFYGGMDVSTVEDRSGRLVRQDGVTLSLSVLQWDGQSQLTPEEVSKLAALLKKRAKAHRGSVYVMEQVTAMYLGEGRRGS